MARRNFAWVRLKDAKSGQWGKDGHCEPVQMHEVPCAQESGPWQVFAIICVRTVPRNT